MITPPELSVLLADPNVTDICLNGGEQLFVDRRDGSRELRRLDRPWGDSEFRQWVLDVLSSAGKTWDARYPFVDTSLASGHRLHVAFPPASPNGILLSLRRTLPPAQSVRWTEDAGYRHLSQAVLAGESIVISGATGSGKTTLVSDLLSHVPPEERLIGLEDTSELHPDHPHFITLLSRPATPDGHGEITLRDLLRQSLRMRPDRIILGECRGNEVLDLLQVLNTGHHGALATLHAHSPRDALRRLELLALLAARGTIPSTLIRELIVSGIQWLVHLKRVNGQREITEISRIDGKEGDTILLRPMLQRGEWIHPVPMRSGISS